jgi:4-hydroxy-tetrahydrodipicolinate synthase
MDITRLRGLGVALATPFDGPAAGDFGAGAVDMSAFRALVSRMVAGGADFLVVLGSTGEAATVTEAERDVLVAAAREEARGLPVIVGAGHNSTAQAVALAARSARSGADGILVVTPYYNKPQGAGIEAHFRAVAAAAPGLPIIVYNVPGRTGQNLLPRDLGRLWTIPEVVAVKESSGNLAQIGEILRTIPKGKLLFSGDDALALPAIALGASGLISVIGNLLPAQTKALVDAALAGRRDEAAALHARLLPMMDALFLESNPAPLKAAFALAGLSADALRLPLLPASESTRARLAELLPDFGIAPGGA